MTVLFRILLHGIAQNFAHNIYTLKQGSKLEVVSRILQDDIDAFFAKARQTFFKIVLVILSRILLCGILQNFACNILILSDNIHVIINGVA